MNLAVLHKSYTTAEHHMRSRPSAEARGGSNYQNGALYNTVAPYRDDNLNQILSGFLAYIVFYFYRGHNINGSLPQQTFSSLYNVEALMIRIGF